MPPPTYPPYQQPPLDRQTGLFTKPWQLFFLSLVSQQGLHAALVSLGSSGGGTGIASLGYWTPITNGDPVSPEILFDSAGECIVGFVPTAS